VSGFRPAELFEPGDEDHFTQQQMDFLNYRRHVLTDEPALARCGVTERRLEAWMEDELFVRLYRSAAQSAVNELEEETRHRALHGFAQPMLKSDGTPIYVRDPLTGDPELDANFEPLIVVEQVPQHQLLPILLKAKRPEYREKGELLVGGVPGKPVEQAVKVEYVLPTGLTMDDYRRRWAEEDARHGSSWPEQAPAT
jgi:hypothetical protein